MITDHTNIFDYIQSQEANYKLPIPINDSWSWSMRDHIKISELYNNSQLLTGKDDFTPVKNITRPILNLQHRTEDIELKDVQIYIDNPDKYHLSLLIKKYHDDVFVQEYDLDTFFDELNISRIDFGAGLSKKLNHPCPECVPLQSIAFCDQTDILSGPIGIKHYYSPDQLLDMAQFGWGETSNGATISLESLISLSREEKKDNNTDNQTSKTPGRYIEIYEIHGNLPRKFKDANDDSGKFDTYLFICAFYQKKDSMEQQGVTLYCAPEKESPFKLIKRDPVFGRACGFGGAEELFEAQVWINYDIKRIQDMLDSASKTILKAMGNNSAKIAQKQKVRDMDNNEIIDVGDGDLAQVDTFPRNSQLFDASVERWEAHAQQMGAANDSIMGQAPTAGTPFKLQELVTNESHGLHEYRRGQYAKHIEGIYKDWIIPHIQKKITEGFKFLSELSLEELQYVSEKVVTNETNKKIKAILFKTGNFPSQEEADLFKEVIQEEFKKKGNKHFLEALKGEFKDAKLGVKVSVAGKSKNLGQYVDKLSNVFRTIMVNPAILQNPSMANLWNQIIEASGLDPVDFSNFQVPPEPQEEQQSPMQPMMKPMDKQMA